MAADKKIKIKVMWIYIAHSRETSKALKHGSHSFTCNYTNACLYLVSVHQMALPLTCDNVRLISAFGIMLNYRNSLLLVTVTSDTIK